MHVELIDTAHPLYAPSVALRQAVLRAPLGRVLEAQELALDAAREHVVAVMDAAVVGSVSLYLETADCLRVKQMAVEPSLQGRGVGQQLMQAAEARGRALGATHVRLHARATVLRFYEKLGYAAQGDAFMELGIAHRVMVKSLPSA